MIPYAVIKASGRQYRVSPGDSLSVEKIEGNPGDSIALTEVLMIGGESTLLGTPTISGATVSVVIERQYRGEKVLVYKKKRRHKYRKMRGHRSELTRLFVSEIASSAGSFKAEGEPNVWDEKRLEEKRQAAMKPKTRVQAADGEDEETKPVKKASAAKKTGGAKKTGAKKKAGAKKSAATKKKAKK